MSRQSASIILDVVMALVTGAIAVAAILPFSVFALICCFSIALTLARARIQGRRGLAVCGSIVSTAVFATIVAVAATYRPAKIVEQQLNRSLTLPATRMTLAELAYHATYDRRRFSVRMWMSLAEEDKHVVVEWSAREITVREFLDAIESQTDLRSKFNHCGNGYTILGGGDCSFGLSVVDPDFSREQFDVNAYAQLRDAPTQP